VRALGVDYGERRIGLALSDATGLLASPWKTLSNDRDLAAAARRLAEEAGNLRGEPDGLGAIVIGLPRRLSGEANEQTGRVQQLAALIAKTIDVPVHLQDERLTSHAADELLRRAEPDWKKRKARIDAVAAAIILQDYLDAHSASRASDIQPS
jgi:putative Holliday junction resolvase